MKNVLFSSLLCITAFTSNQPVLTTRSTISLNDLSRSIAGNNGTIVLQNDSGSARMTSIEFKAQEYCRAELCNFEYNVHFSIVGATVYFSGANFRTVEKGMITSGSLAPIRQLMNRCAPGTIVTFDDVKVVGPDKMVRQIQGKSIVLY